MYTMRYVLLFIITVFAMGCVGNKMDDDDAVSYIGAELIDNFRVIPTNYVYNGEGGLPEGRVGLLFSNSSFVDSVYQDFGLVYINLESVIYRKFGGNRWSEYVIFDGNHKYYLSDVIPCFRNHSEPNFVDKYVMYWAFCKNDMVYAAMYDIRSSALDTVYVTKDIVETDVHDYWSPVVRGDSILFAYKDSLVVLSREFKRIGLYGQ